MATTVYLDQWAWIQLAPVHHGKSEEWKGAYEAVTASADAGTARFPLSLSHLIEIARRGNDASRSRLVDFMIEVWNADAIRPWVQMLDREATNAIRIMMGEDPIDLTNFVFGKGISHLLGGTPVLVPKHTGAVPDGSESDKELWKRVEEPSPSAWGAHLLGRP